MNKDLKVPETFKEIIDVLIGEVALTRRKIESLVEILDEKGLLTQEEFKIKVKEKSEKEKIEILMDSFSNESGKK
jgi:hypothetical protein